MTPNDPAAPFVHRPVMEAEVVELFGPIPAGVLVDATVGGGGHAGALLAALPQIRLLGLDRDPAAVHAARARLAEFGDRATVVQARFDRLAEVMSSAAIPKVSGVLFDLGVSSHQFDRPERGFSYRFEAPLDMRMDPSTTTTAADLVNTLPESDLRSLIARYGDERFASRIASAIVSARPVGTTTELAATVRGAIPAPARRRGGDPAKRTFQALRLAVNQELEVLQPALEAALSALVVGGRCVVLAYHSGEDRIVKAEFRGAATGWCTCPDRLPCVCGATPSARLLRKGSRKPAAAEVLDNPRAESARLRAIEKITEVSIPGQEGRS